MRGSRWRTAVVVPLLAGLGACSGPDEPSDCGDLAESVQPQPSASAPSDELVQEFTDSIKDEPWFSGAGLSADKSGYYLLVFAREDPDLASEFKGVRVKACKAGPFSGSIAGLTRR